MKGQILLFCKTLKGWCHLGLGALDNTPSQSGGKKTPNNLMMLYLFAVY
jgi:hypothetical protein